MDNLKKRRLVRKFTQVCAALIYNANLPGFASGRLYTGVLKGVCVPGLNCYSCPGAIGACPLGSLQGSITRLDRAIPFYVVGTLLLFGALLGRFVCAFLCPFGLLQELFYMIPTPKIRKSRVTRILSLLKYVVLAVFVLAIPIYTLVVSGVAVPGFCKYICPSGTLFGGIPLVFANAELMDTIGALFDWKVLVAIIIILLSIFVYRPFCRFICPLGAIYSFFNKIALFGVKVDHSKCTDCGACVKFCKSDVKCINDRECIRCGECRSVCPHGAIYANFERKKSPPENIKSKEEI